MYHGNTCIDVEECKLLLFFRIADVLIQAVVCKNFGERFDFFSNFIELSSAGCESKPILNIMDALVRTGPKGFLYRHELVSVCGSKHVVNELVKKNMLYSRTLPNVVQGNLDSMVSRYKERICAAACVADLHIIKNLLQGEDHKAARERSSR